MLKKVRFYLVLITLLALGRSAVAQRENSNWYFGTNATVNFPPAGPPTALTGSAMSTYEACASVSDNAGQPLFYTNSETLWNRNNQVMVNGTNLGGHASCSQGVAIVQNPGNTKQYYVFVHDAAETLFAGGLKYSLVDMTRQNGLGEVVQTRTQVSSVRLTEKLTTVPHTNGRDTWVLVHGWESNTFYAYLLTAAGVQATPVTTGIGAVHAGGGGANGNANGVGYMRVSADGRRLALGIRDQNFELFDFDAATGKVANYVPLNSFYRSYGVEFSPNGRFLYGTNLDGLGVYQYDLQAGSSSAVASSGLLVGTTANNVGAVQVGPDGKLYVSVLYSPYLAVIDNPNVRGSGCGFRANGVFLNGNSSQIGLPNYPNSRVAPFAFTAAFTSTAACAGSAVSFTGTTTPALTGTTATWNFGDPASGSANAAAGLAATHVYGQAGTYQVTLTVAYPGLAPATSTQTVTVGSLPVVRLGADTLVCSSAVWTLRTNPQPAGTLFRWQDGSTAPTYLARGPGQYSVQVQLPSGCPATATRVAAAASCLVTIPNIITPNGDSQNEFFTLKGITPADWHLSIFDRWGRQVYEQAHYDNHWNAPGQGAGIYYYLLKNPATGERYQGWVEVMRGS